MANAVHFKPVVNAPLCARALRCREQGLHKSTLHNRKQGFGQRGFGLKAILLALDVVKRKGFVRRCSLVTREWTIYWTLAAALHNETLSGGPLLGAGGQTCPSKPPCHTAHCGGQLPPSGARHGDGMAKARSNQRADRPRDGTGALAGAAAASTLTRSLRVRDEAYSRAAGLRAGASGDRKRMKRARLNTQAAAAHAVSSEPNANTLTRGRFLLSGSPAEGTRWELVMPFHTAANKHTALI
ncbi:hypothetical protein SKAU_G00034250 [Synaphobranchus kaupii]|uniref:Uncharacterized protein n=1 Tax=Synaphobranchus kaupii TaxID=118154 RepID=A0A9Q1JGD8_SYNKA|nr:hypothetical protein SKAU_G00034250 [Synaphobranchus kaupii]